MAEFERWEKAGLLKPTVIQCSKLLRLDRNRIGDRKYGRLTATDIIGVQAMLKYLGVQNK